MNKAMNQQAIESYLSSMGKEVLSNYVFAYIEPSNLDFVLLGGLSFIKIKNFIVVFYEDEILLIPLTQTSDFDLTQNPVSIERKSINNIKIKKGIMQYKVTIATNKGDLIFKIGKKILGNPWQSNNLRFLEANNWII